MDRTNNQLQLGHHSGEDIELTDVPVIPVQSTPVQ